ncbi:MAG: putative geopeptide radical SAM maturase [Geobacteraceae bacterium GWC2_53_11]|nr:MAG: putative geopeptide radical SAM maturase [Geobacteraceae bacterium GWC2_53_11]
MQLSNYLKIFPCPEQPGMNLVYSTLRSSVVQLPDDLLEAARNGALDDEDRDVLARIGILTADRAAEQEHLRTIFAVPRPGTPFNAIVVLNLDCNLACPYCYEDQFRGKHYMSEATAALLVETILRERVEKGQPVKLTFYGGEPLLSLDLIRAISVPLREAALVKGVSFSFSLVTNGTLLNRACAEELVALGLAGAKITLDGPAELHNVSRPFVSGNGSYEAIIRNVRDVYDIVPLQLGGNFTQYNYRDFPRMLDDLLERGIDPAKAGIVQFAPVIPKSGEKMVTDFNTGCTCSYEPWLMEASVWLREETLKRGFPAPKPKLSVCMVELEHDLVIGIDGSYYKCPAFMAYPELRIGSLSEGIADYRESHNMDVWKKEECLSCAYLPICFGGCRQLTLLRNGTIDEVDCRREYYDTVLERIVRQDLEYQRSKL